VDYTEYSLDGGAWTRKTTVTVTAPSDHSQDGRHTLAYRSADLKGHLEATKTATILIDTTPPLTTQTGGGALWHNHNVTVRFTAKDARAGVAHIEYTTNAGKTWLWGSWALVPALESHSNDGSHVIGYRSVDLAGNVETQKNVTVRIDTRHPTTVAPYRASVRRYRYVTLRYRVKDPLPTSGKATVTIKVKTLGGRTVKTLKPGLRRVNTSQVWRFRCGLARATYRFMVYATDRAANKQAIVGVNRLRVY